MSKVRTISWILLFIAGAIILTYQITMSDHTNKSKITNLQKNEERIVDKSSFLNKITLNKNELPDNITSAYGFGLRLYDSYGQFYNTDTISLDNNRFIFASLVNTTDFDSEIGLLMLIDGVPQSFSIDNNSETDFLYKLVLPKKSFINIPVLLSQPIVVKDTSHTLSIIMLYDLNIVPNEQHPFIDFYTNTMIKKVSFNDNMLYTKDQESIGVSIANTIDNPGKGVITKINASNEKPNYNTQKPVIEFNDSKQEIIISNRAPAGKYTSLLLIDNELTNINDKNYYIWASEGVNRVTNIAIDLSNRFAAGKHSIYQITVPLQKYIPFTYGSSKQFFIVNNH